MIRRAVALALAAFLLAFAGSGIAQAHSIPVSSDPADGSTIDVGPPRVSVTFNEALQDSFASLTVVGPDGNLWSEGDATVDGPTVDVALRKLGPAGVYTIAYRVVSADGHTVSGTREFTLSKADTGTPGPPAATESSDAEGIPPWVFVAGAAVLFAGGLAFALRRPKKG